MKKNKKAIFVDHDLAVVLAEIRDELARAKSKHPRWPEDPIYAAAIVGEESGELTRAALQHKFENGLAANMRIEAIQTVVTAIRFLLETPCLKENATAQHTTN